MTVFVVFQGPEKIKCDVTPRNNTKQQGREASSKDDIKKKKKKGLDIPSYNLLLELRYIHQRGKISHKIWNLKGAIW